MTPAAVMPWWLISFRPTMKAPNPTKLSTMLVASMGRSSRDVMSWMTKKPATSSSAESTVGTRNSARRPA